jgi:ATP sulfurylase
MGHAGVSLFRINLSHTNFKDLENIIIKIRRYSDIPICIDTEGAQIRTGLIKSGEAHLKENDIIRVASKQCAESKADIYFTPDGVTDQLEIGDLITIDFNSALAQVIDKTNLGLSLKVLNPGYIKSNKAVNVNRQIQLPTMTEKDKKSIALGVKLGIRHYALSFAHKASDVRTVREYLPKETVLISKIECHQAIANLEEIIMESDAILIDRGDLSREEPIEKIPFLQKYIIKKAKQLEKKVSVATNLLESMIINTQPTRAEVNDIYNTLLDGADALVLAAETAIGKWPIKAVNMVAKMIVEFEREQEFVRSQTSFASNSLFSSLPEPHGGEMVDQMLPPEKVEDIRGLERVPVSIENLIDAEQIALGVYSPLTGFMTSTDLNSVLDSYQLFDGIPWTMPIILQVKRNVAKSLKNGKKYLLTDRCDEAFSLISVEEIYTINLKDTVKRWFSTDSPEHPGVKRVLSGGSFIVGGKIQLIKRLPSPHREYELTPKELRFLFDLKGWRRIVGFHTRNVAHCGHEYIQRRALESTNADGLLISPVLGPKKVGDFRSELVLRSYQMMIRNGAYPPGKAFIGGLLTYPRYCGPREAVFTALCRKNMGCSHFIVGRDHAGVGEFYKTSKSQDLFKEVGDIGIVPVFFGAIGYNKKTQQYEEESGSVDIVSLSATRVRETILKGEKLPNWFIDEDVQEMLLSSSNSKHGIIYQ